MIEIIRPIPGHLDAAEVKRLAAEGMEYVTGRRSMLSQRRLYAPLTVTERTAVDRGIDACDFIRSEARPAAARLVPARHDLQMAAIALRDYRARYEAAVAREAECAAAVAALEALADDEHADALADAEARATGAEVAA